MRLSVVIPCYNAQDTIAAQLEALTCQRWSGPWEVIVCDNGSTDESRSVVEQYSGRLPGLRIVDASASRGRAHARNVGVGSATGDAVLFVDADDEVSAGWLSAMGEALSQHDFVACRVDFKRLNAPWAWMSRDHPQQDGLETIRYPPYLPHAGSGTIGIRRSLFEAIGGFDEGLPALEDTDLCFRTQLAGVGLHFVPDAIVHVRCRHGSRDIFRQSRMWARYNVMLSKRYRGHGTPASRPWRRYVLGWRYLIRQTARIHDKASFARWLFMFGWMIGLLQGSVRYLSPPV